MTPSTSAALPQKQWSREEIISAVQAIIVKELGVSPKEVTLKASLIDDFGPTT